MTNETPKAPETSEFDIKLSSAHKQHANWWRNHVRDEVFTDVLSTRHDPYAILDLLFENIARTTLLFIILARRDPREGRRAARTWLFELLEEGIEAEGECALQAMEEVEKEMKQARINQETESI